MKREVFIMADTIDAAAEEILGILESMSKQLQSIYFNGWCRLGASSALRVVAQHLKSSAAQEMKFDKVLHVDCSLWESMRALQKAVAEELELPQSVMAIFNQHDEEDDFNGIDQCSRGVIKDVREEIFKRLAGNSFIVIFHNGSSHYIDLYDCGIPVTTFLSNKVLWTWGGGFRLRGNLKGWDSIDFQRNTYMVPLAELDHALQEEAADVANRMGILDPDTIVECFQYVWKQTCAGQIDWGMHASNYWVCDGIIQGQGGTCAWEVGDGLFRNINLDWIEEYDNYIGHVCISDYDDRWVLATHQDLLHDGIGVLPPEATSFFLLPEKSEGRVVLPAVMFPYNNRLHVLHLSWCTFSFTSPPFLCCRHLRFLLLDHCTDIKEEIQSNSQNRSCFQKLWVFDLRYTDWYSKTTMGLMDELRELNVERVKDWMSIVDICGSRSSLVKFRVAPDPDSPQEIIMHRQLPNLSSAIHLKTVILENCVGLEQVVPDVLPPLVESFSFILTDAAIPKISSISFRGLGKLKSVFLRGMMENLLELDLSGSAVKSLDLREVVALNLKQLIVMGCDKLKAIQWPSSDERTKKLEVLRIDTLRPASSGHANWEEKAKETSGATRSSCFVAVEVRDARLLRSLKPIRECFYRFGIGHMEMSSSPASSVVGGGSECGQGIRNPNQYLYARDIFIGDHLQAVAANEGLIEWMWDGPSDLAVDRFKHWYVHIQDEEEMKNGLLLQLQQQQDRTEHNSIGGALLPFWLCYGARTLHVHDSLYNTSIPSTRNSHWPQLEECRVERCPKLSFVFATPIKSEDGSNKSDTVGRFPQLTTFWAYQLSMARYIWNWSTIQLSGEDSFQHLEFLHLDYCPRLIHVLPLSVHMTTLRHLATLEVVCCGDLMEIFPLDPTERQEKQTIINFPELKHIHLHDLPRLKHICGGKMFAPKLETIKTRGCWNLGRLPAVARSCPEVDCEKEWWDNLQWDEGDANHHPSLYKLCHSMYYKMAQLPRGTVLM
uniref:Predicted protein n=5 Tax=Hordeum vulgare TaxID=4513 RepID=F2EK01_HORVV|nr:predicted protein [Hordeum vulgare subsp. vulgare]